MKRERLTREEKEKKVEQVIEEARTHRKRKRFKKGIDLLVDALRYKVKEDQIYYRLGNIYYDAGDLDRAEYSYQRAIEKNKDHVNAHHNLSVVYKKKGRISSFVKMKKKATKLAAKNPSQADLNQNQIKWLKSLGYKLLLGIVGIVIFLGIIIFLLRFL